jgi:hypothetical protein
MTHAATQPLIRTQEDFRRQADTARFNDKMRYMVRCAYFHNNELTGTYWVERDENETDKATTIELLMNGEWTHPLQVVEFNSVECTSSDVSEDFALEIVKRVAACIDGDNTIGQAAYDFCERNGGHGIVHGLRVA